MISTIKRIPLSLAIILLVMTILRLPNFVEPYWYGDEGIYLTIGTALNQGEKLYAEIVDHKTPLIYYLAMVGSQLNFRILLYLWMFASTIIFFLVAERLFNNRFVSIVSTSMFMLSTTLPWFEGNIPNGELFVMGFTLAGIWLLLKTNYAQVVTQSKQKLTALAEAKWLFISGILMSLGVLTKVPAIFEFAAALSLGYFLLLYRFQENKLKNIFQTLRTIFLSWMWLGFGLLAPLLVSILYYTLRGTAADYLQFGLLYNFHYAGNWDLGFENQLLVFFFTLHGKAIYLIISFILLGVLFFLKKLSAKTAFILGWFNLSLVASLLSNRPYPHYFLQVFPAAALTVGVLTDQIIRLAKTKKQRLIKPISSIGLSLFYLFLGSWIMLIMHVGLYPTLSYYLNYFSFASNQISATEYHQRFNYLMTDNYRVASIIANTDPDEIFIWGTNPMLYALTETSPVGKFTVAFHIEDLGVQDQTIEAVYQAEPYYVVVMKDQQTSLPGLPAYLNTNYLVIEELDHMVLWKKRQVPLFSLRTSK